MLILFLFRCFVTKLIWKLLPLLPPWTCPSMGCWLISQSCVWGGPDQTLYIDAGKLESWWDTFVLLTMVFRPDGVVPEDAFDSEYLNCTGNPEVVLEGRKSFPSGHSSFSFSAWGFVFFYLSGIFKKNPFWLGKIILLGKLGTFHCTRPSPTWKLLLPLVFLVVPMTIAISRTADYHHHWQDVVVGSLLGLSVVWMVYRQVGLIYFQGHARFLLSLIFWFNFFHWVQRN